MNLQFYWCDNITEEGLNNLCQGIKPLDSLAFLNLNFGSCKKITLERFKHLYEFLSLYQQQPEEREFKRRELMFSRKLDHDKIKSPENLSALEFVVNLKSGKYSLEEKSSGKTCEKNSLTEQQLIAELNKRLDPSLRSLKLHFYHCKKMNDKSLEVVFSQVFKNLTSLTSLDLRFPGYSEITDQSLSHLTYLVIKNLTGLKVLHLNFSTCWELTDKGLNILCCQGLKNLTLLTSLSIKYVGVSAMTDESLNTLCSQVIKNLPFLTSLTVDFSEIKKITDASWNNFQEILHYFGFDK